MKKVKILLVLLVITSMFGMSCSKDNDNNNNSSRVVKYEITGNYSGSILIAYTTASGGTSSETITVLPWSKDITYASTVSSASIALSGTGGVAGQTVSLVVKRTGSAPLATPGTADGTGIISVAGPGITF